MPNQNDSLITISEAPVLVSDNKTRCDCNEWKIASLQETHLNLSVCGAWNISYSYTRKFVFIYDLLSAKDIITKQRENIAY